MLGNIDIDGIMEMFTRVAYQPGNPARLNNTINFITTLIASPEVANSKIPIGALLTNITLYVVEHEADENVIKECFAFAISTFLQMDIPCFIQYDSLVGKDYLIPILDLYRKGGYDHQ